MKKVTQILAIMLLFVFCLTSSSVTTLAANVQQALGSQVEKDTEVEMFSEIESENEETEMLIEEVKEKIPETEKKVPETQQTEVETVKEAVTLETEREETESQAIETEEETEPETKEVTKSKSPRAVGATSDYLSYKANPKALNTGATIKDVKSAMPETYSGFFIKNSDGYSITKSVNYNSGVYYIGSGLQLIAYNLNKQSKDTLTARYPNAYSYEGQSYDVEVVVHDWALSNGSSGAGTDSDGNDISVMAFRTDYPGVYVAKVDSIEMDHNIYEAGTNKLVSTKGYVTFQDIDWGQGVILKGSEWKEVYAASEAESTLRYQTTTAGYPYYFAKDDTFSSNAGDPDSQISAMFSGSSLRMTYTFCRASGNDSEGTMGLSSEKLYQGPVEIEKFVSDNDEKMVTSDTLNHSPSPRKETFYYTLEVRISPEVKETYYSTFAVRDDIDVGLSVNSDGITVSNEEGTNVTSYFDIAVSASNVLGVVAKSTQLAKASFYGHVYHITVPVNIKDTTNLLDYWDSSKEMAKFDNTFSLTYDVKKIDSNEVHTYVPDVVPNRGALEVTKVEKNNTSVKIAATTFNVYQWSKGKNGYDTAIYDVLIDEGTEGGTIGLYKNSKPYPRTTDNEFKFKIVESKAAPGYINSGWSQEVTFDGTSIQKFTYTVDNEKMNPEIKVAKKFDKTTAGALEKGKYTSKTVADWYDFSEDAIATLTVTNTGNVPLKTIILTEEMQADLKAVTVNGTYVVPAGIKSNKGKAVTVSVDVNDNTKLHISVLEVGDSIDIDYKVKLIPRTSYTSQKLLDLLNKVIVNATYNDGSTDRSVTPDQDDDKINIYNPDISIEKTALPAGVKELTDDIQKKGNYWFDCDDEIHYNILVKNEGNVPLYQSVVKDTIDEDLKTAILVDKASFVIEDEITSALGNKVNVTKNSQNEIGLDILEVGDSVNLKYVVTVKEYDTVQTLSKLEKLVNTVTVNSGYKDPENPTMIPEEKDDDIVNIYRPKVGVEKITLAPGETKLPNETEVTNEGGAQDEVTDPQISDSGETQYWFDCDDTITFSIKVTNEGNTPLYKSVVKDIMDEDLKAAVQADKASFDVPEEVTSNLGNAIKITTNSNTELILDVLEVGDFVYLKFIVIVQDYDTIQSLAKLNKLVNTVKVNSGYKDPEKPKKIPEEEDDTIINIYKPGVAVEKTALPAGVTDWPGEGIEKQEGGYWYAFDNEIHFEIKVRNTGNTPLYKTVVKDTMDDQLKAAVLADKATFVVPEKVTSALGNTVTVTMNSSTELTLDILEVGDDISLKFVVTVADWETIKQPDQLESLVNNVKVNSGYKDPEDPKRVPEVEDDELVNIYKAKVSITKDADKEVYSAGETVKYTLKVSNDGNTPLYNLLVADAMDEALKNAVKKGTASYVLPKEAKTEKGDKVKLTLGTDYEIIIDKLAVGDKIIFNFEVTLKDGKITVFEQLKNTVKVTGEYGEREVIPEDEDDTDEADIDVFHGYVEVRKLSAGDGKALAGAEFAIYDAKDKKVGTLKTDKKGYAVSEALYQKSYYLKETKAPGGYQLSDKKYHFKLKKNGETVKIEIENKAETATKTTKSEAVKTGDSSNLPLYFAFFLGASLIVSILFIIKFKKKKHHI